MSTAYRDRDVYAFPTPGRVRSSQHRMHFGCLGAVILTLLVIAAVCIIGYNYEYGTETSAVFTVKQLDDQATSKSHQYLVFTDVPGTNTAAEVFKDTDAPFHGKWSSSNLFSFLTVGDTYRCTVYGFRNGLFSTYRDLLVCSQLSVKQAAEYRSEWVKAVS